MLLNNEAFYNALGGKKPITDGSLIFPIDLTTPNVYTFTSAGGAVGSQALADFVGKNLKAKRVIVVRTDNPAGLSAAQDQIKRIQAEGVQAVDVPLPEPGTAPQYVEAIRAANPQPGDVIQLSLTSIGASTVYDALQTVNVPNLKVLAAELAALPPMPGHLKDLGLSDTVYPNGWYMADSSYSAYMPAPSSNGADVYVNMMSQYDPTAATIYGYAPVAFAEVLETAKFITEAGGANATAESIAAKIKAYRGPAVLSSNTVHCGAFAAAPNMCAFTAGYEQRVDGKWVSVADGINGKGLNVLSELQQSH